MAQNKTQATDTDPRAYIAAIADEARRKDCAQLLKLMKRASGQPAKMWGPAIVGFGSYKYPLSGGREGEICAVGFSSRASAISVYSITGGDTQKKLLAKLGKYKLGKGCLYISKLADVDLGILEQLVATAARAKLLS